MAGDIIDPCIAINASCRRDEACCAYSFSKKSSQFQDDIFPEIADSNRNEFQKVLV
jgi:hypothetical protein